MLARNEKTSPQKLVKEGKKTKKNTMTLTAADVLEGNQTDIQKTAHKKKGF